MNDRVFKMSGEQKLKALFDESMALQKRLMGQRWGGERMDYSVDLFTRQTLCAYTLWNICHPKPAPELLKSEATIHDFQSGLILLRAMYETILTSNFLLLSPTFDGARNVVIKVAILHGYREQNMLLTTIGSRHPKLRSIQRALEDLRPEIRDHPEFACLPEYCRNYVEKEPDMPSKKKWHNKKMEDLASMAGFHSSQHTEKYKYFSNYVHADPYAVRQVGAVRRPEEAENMTSIVIDYAENFLSLSLDIHVRVSQSEKFDVELSPLAREIVEYWTDLNAGDLSKGYRD